MSLINLLPEDYTQRRAARRTNAIALVMFAVVMAGMLAGVSFNQKRVNSTQEVLTHVTGEYQNAAKLIEKLNQLDKTKKTAQEKTKMTGELVERQPRSYILALVTNALPETACVVSLKLYSTKEKAPVAPVASGARTRGKEKPKEVFVTEMEITGLATTDLDVTMIMTNLKASPLMRTVNLLHTQDKQMDIKDPVTGKVVEQRVFRDFKLRVSLNSDVDVMDLLAEQRKTVLAFLY